jgi:hypothetical protein
MRRQCLDYLDMSKFFRKKYRWDGDVVNELLSCRQFVGGTAPKDNNKFVVEVLNRAVRYTLHNHPFFKAITEVDEADRTYGKVIDLKISRESWLGVQEKIDQMRAMGESDLLQFCVRHYLPYVKSMRALPDDPEFHLEEETQQFT